MSADGKDLQKFSVDEFTRNAKEELRDGVRVAILRAMPVEALDAMVAAEVTAFLEDKRVDPYYTHQRTTLVPSGLKQVVHEVLTAEVKAAAKRYLESDAWTGTFDQQGKRVLGDNIKQMFIDAGPQMMASMMAGIVDAHVQQLKMQLGVR